MPAAYTKRLRPHEIVVLVAAATGPQAEERLHVYREQRGPEAPVVAGDAAQIAEGIHEYAAAGATKIILEPFHDDPESEAFVHFVAEQLQPLTRWARKPPTWRRPS